VNTLFPGAYYAGLLRGFIFVCVFCVPIGFPLAFAQSNSDVEKIFNWAENNFPRHFRDHQMTLTAGAWQYRFYPSANVYIGVRDEQVFVLGSRFGSADNPVFVDTVSGLLTQIENDPGVPSCKNPKNGFTATQSGNVINITSNGQCLSVPDDICEIPTPGGEKTEKSVMHKTTMTATQYSGIEFDSPAASAILDLFNATKSNKLCTVNTPEDSVKLVTHTDICQDVTPALQALSLPGITVTPPVMLQYTTTTKNRLVFDCFKTDADVIFDLSSWESWTRQVDGSFTKNSSRRMPGEWINQVKLDRFDRDLNALIQSDDPALANGEALAKDKNCFNCHILDQKLVGPAFRTISEKYENDAGAAQNLVDKILNGSSGVWGKIPMPPNPALSDADALTLAEWILALP
jgi:cytochrome c551/c552